MSLDANADRFSGFADLYDTVRPTPPSVLAEVVTKYARGRPALTVDLGCGTGLSTRWASRWSDEVIGVEPSDDMRVRATTATPAKNIRYEPGWSSATGIPDGSADVVLAVQALHWMDPIPTFVEVARLLRPGGVFAALDCDWPPSVGDAAAEQAWHAARAIIASHEREIGVSSETEAPVPRLASSSPQTDDLRPRNVNDRAAAVTITDGVQFWHKNEHLGRMVRSGEFGHCVEIAALTEERGDADRLVQLFRSQGDYQALRRHGLDDHTLGVDVFADRVHASIGSESRPFWFTYRARVGVRYARPSGQ
ncbi:MAG: class I SAM-dependent methyltransferase [Ilumatobacteraceae bacterium]